MNVVFIINFNCTFKSFSDQLLEFIQLIQFELGVLFVLLHGHVMM